MRYQDAVLGVLLALLILVALFFVASDLADMVGR